ncbi:MAG: DUF4145 domain-containing protein [Rhodoferax sp.]|nr:DUF4145 domain-containing protein [Rhodoferax sp.]
MQLCTAAERNFAAQDPNTCLLKLRQFGEALAQHVAALLGVDASQQTSQADLLMTLQRRHQLDRSVADMLHLLRQRGNAANHHFAATPITTTEALSALRVARELALWLHRAFGKSSAAFKPGPFVAPVMTDYASVAHRLQAEVAVKTAQAEAAWASVTDEGSPGAFRPSV